MKHKIAILLLGGLTHPSSPALADVRQVDLGVKGATCAT
jgi:hypothetical protein